MEVFLDTGYLIALEDADDQDHVAAHEHWRELPAPPMLRTTTYVFDEVVTFSTVAATTERRSKSAKPS